MTITDGMRLGFGALLILAGTFVAVYALVLGYWQLKKRLQPRDELAPKDSPK